MLVINLDKYGGVEVIVVDRIGEEFAYCEYSETCYGTEITEILKILKCEIIDFDNLKEGDLLIKVDKLYIVDLENTLRRRQKILDKFNRL